MVVTGAVSTGHQGERVMRDLDIRISQNGYAAYWYSEVLRRIKLSSDADLL